MFDYNYERGECTIHPKVHENVLFIYNYIDNSDIKSCL